MSEYPRKPKIDAEDCITGIPACSEKTKRTAKEKSYPFPRLKDDVTVSGLCHNL